MQSRVHFNKKAVSKCSNPGRGRYTCGCCDAAASGAPAPRALAKKPSARAGNLPGGDAAAVLARGRCVLGVWRAQVTAASGAQVTAACADGAHAVLDQLACGHRPQASWP